MTVTCTTSMTTTLMNTNSAVPVAARQTTPAAHTTPGTLTVNRAVMMQFRTGTTPTTLLTGICTIPAVSIVMTTVR